MMHYSIYSMSTPLRSNASISFIAADPEVRSRLLWCTFTESPESSPLLATSGPRSLISLSSRSSSRRFVRLVRGPRSLISLSSRSSSRRFVRLARGPRSLISLSSRVEFPEVCQVGEGAKIADLVTFEVEFLEIRQVGEGAKVADSRYPRGRGPGD
jgi:hypothetical protein